MAMAKAKNEAQGGTEAPEMQIEYWDIDKLIPYARNPRKNDDAVPKMAGLIKEFGFKVPVVIRSDGEVIDGHLRLKAARQLGMEKVPVVLADEWTPAQVKAFRLAVNRSAEWA
jgi:ParB-like chromosome segregation protein Spo0J